MTCIVVFTSWLVLSPTYLFNGSWLLVFIAGLVLMAVSITPIFCLFVVLGPTLGTIGPSFLLAWHDSSCNIVLVQIKV
jgi:hypothetical protein